MKKSRFGKKYTNCVNAKVYVTSHAIKQLEKRNLKYEDNKSYSNNNKPIQLIINMVNDSKVIEMTVEDGKSIEKRSHKGIIFVCERVKGKTFLDKDTLKVITIKLSKINMRECFSNNFSYEKLDGDSLGLKNWRNKT